MQNPNFKSGIPDWIKEIKSTKLDIEKSAIKVEKKKEVSDVKEKSGQNFLSFSYIIKPNNQSEGKIEVSEKRKCEEQLNTKFYKESIFEENQQKNEKILNNVDARLESLVINEEVLSKEITIMKEDKDIRKKNKQPSVQLSFEFISGLIGRFKTNKERILAVLNEVKSDLKISYDGHESIPMIVEFIDEVQEVFLIKSKENEQKRMERFEKYENEGNKLFELRDKMISTIKIFKPVVNDSAFERNLISIKKNVDKAKNVLEEVKQELFRFTEDMEKQMINEPICEELEIDVYMSMIIKKMNSSLLEYKKNVSEYFFKIKQKEKENFEEFLKVAEEIM